MVRRLVALAALAVLSVSSTASAQLGFGIAAGPTIPTGSLGDRSETGRGVMGIVNIGIPLLPVGIRLEGAYNSFDSKPTISSSTSARVLSATANAVVSTPGFIGPYFIGGLGVYNTSSQCISACGSSSNNVGANAGVGFKLGIAGLSVFGEARYHYVPSSSSNATSFIPISVGLTF